MKTLIKQILDKQKIEYKTLTKATSGFTNVVYFIDDAFVIKLSNNEKTKKQLEKEISIYKNLNIDNIPKFVASGDFDCYKFLIITKLNGNSLYSIWHKLEDSERHKIINQIALILKNFHSQNSDYLHSNYKFQDWHKEWSKKLENVKIGLNNLNFETMFLDIFIEKYMPKILSDNIFGLVYNDAHFDNFLYDGEKVYLIDFDRVIYCPIDYEMMIFKTMCDNPSKFASEEDEQNIDALHYEKIYDWFKHLYPKLFEINYVEQRINLYQFEYLIKQGIECKNIEFIKEQIEFFKNNLLK